MAEEEEGKQAKPGTSASHPYLSQAGMDSLSILASGLHLLCIYLDSNEEFSFKINL